MEIWKNIPYFEKYQVSNLGRLTPHIKDGLIMGLLSRLLKKKKSTRY